MKPTEESYEELQKAYDFYNARLFCSTLPACLITPQRKEYRVLGYFSQNRFGSGDGLRTDELAMNPMHFHSRETEDVLSTLVHEMVHVWQSHFGNPGRGRYHNREWGDKMKSIGLHPLKTGLAGGCETGDQMTHYIVRDGEFDCITASLLQGGFRLTWAEQPAKFTKGPGGADPTIGRDKSNRTRYQCQACRAKV